MIGFVGTLTGCIGSAPAPNNDVLVFGRKGLDDGRFEKPRAITVNENDEIFVVDKTSRIQVFDRDGKFIRMWRTPECYAGKPCGMSISQDGMLMVCDTHYFRVLFYSYDGQMDQSRTIGGVNGRGPGEFGFVTDVVQDSKGNFFISEYGDYDRIQKFTPDGEYVYEWGGHGEEPGQFLRPQGMVMDQNDHLWVADASNHRIQVFDVSGDKPEVIKVWGESGSEAGFLSYPYELILDEKDNGGKGSIYVCEFGNHRVQKFTLDGKSLGTWGSAGREKGKFHQPWSMCRDSQGDFFVVDSYNHRLQRFKFENQARPPEVTVQKTDAGTPDTENNDAE
ncbi:MAG: hypothetical protein AB8B55_12100 [Mariniblastus sp.]